MKELTATYSNPDAAQNALEALRDAEIEEQNLVHETMDNGDTLVSVLIDEGKTDAVAAILRSGSAFHEEARDVPVAPAVEGHPDGSGPVTLPLVPER